MITAKDYKDKFKSLLTELNIDYNTIAKIMNLKSQQAVSMKLARGNLTVIEERNLLSELGYTVRWERKGRSYLSAKDIDFIISGELKGLCIWLERLNMINNPEIRKQLKNKEIFNKEDINNLEELNHIEYEIMKSWTVITTILKVYYRSYEAARELKKVEKYIKERYENVPSFMFNHI
ncbi:hypothetical protein [Selenomonas ruminantium]|uniref:hypothetical protein n=1 Tax=Selenomonas ruminantium TaxID=971 RepID=UPI0026EA69D5|nr:hypothetical protein [Selenomonas ruminantium]